MNLYHPIANLLFPSRCACCGQLTRDRELICSSCHSALPHVPLNCCRKCGNTKAECECNRINLLFSGIAVPFYNNGVAKRGVYDMKFKSRRDNAKFFGICMAERFTEFFGDVEIDLVTAVPTSKNSINKNGFDHAATLAKVVAKHLNIKFCGRLLKRVGNSKPQHSLSYADRISSVKDLYRADKSSVEGKKILLVDDICTTAATLNACTKQLLLAGAIEVYCATALITQKSKEKDYD